MNKGAAIIRNVTEKLEYYYYYYFMWTKNSVLVR